MRLLYNNIRPVARENRSCNEIILLYNSGMAERGRPKLDPKGKASTLLAIRTTEAERAAYERAAERAGKTLSEWIRDRLGRAAKRA
jgi:hypothetical protein